MIRSKLRGAFLLTAVAMLPLAGCRTTVVEHNQPVAQPDHHDVQPDRRDNNGPPDRRDNNPPPDHPGPDHDNGGH